MDRNNFQVVKSVKIDFVTNDDEIKAKDTYPKDILFLKRALETSKRVKGYGTGGERRRVYSLPSHIQDRLDAINKEVDEKRRGIEHKEDIDEESGSRFYKKAQKLIKDNNSDSIKSKLRKNIQVILVVFFGAVGYYLYGENIRNSDTQDIATMHELMERVPLRIDSQTVMANIKEKEDEFIILMQKDKGIYDNVSEEERERSLDYIVSKMPMLCNNPIINKTIQDGKKITVIISDLGKTYRRETTLSHCPLLKENTLDEK